MTKLTTNQVEFAKLMTIKQRGVLHALAMVDCYMSASEIADEELKELVRNRFAQYLLPPGAGARMSWGITDAGRAISHRIRKGAL